MGAARQWLPPFERLQADELTPVGRHGDFGKQRPLADKIVGALFARVPEAEVVRHRRTVAVLADDEKPFFRAQH